MQRFIILLSFWMLGCHKVSYTTNHPHDNVHISKEMFFFGGLIGEPEVDLQEICPQGTAWVQQRVTPGNALLSYLTLGILSPITVEVRCKKQDVQAWLEIDNGLSNTGAEK